MVEWRYHYGGVTVSTWKLSIDCMRRELVGLLKKLAKKQMQSMNLLMLHNLIS